MLHRFDTSVAQIPRPERLNDPFHYEPHPLCRLAARQLQTYLSQHTEWADELSAGKMFGVFVVSDSSDELGFLAAFSGNLAGTNRHDYFVPPVYDMLAPGDFFRREEQTISAINHRIASLEQAPRLLRLQRITSRARELAKEALSAEKQRMQTAKCARDKRRAETTEDRVREELIRESQFQRANFQRLKQRWHRRIAALQEQLNTSLDEIERLREERKERSAALQMELFRQFRMRNSLGEVRDLCDIFASTPQGVPPAGAGECAAPKLLQYAFEQGLKPLAIAEFWWGASPRGEIRHHGHYYPACRGKCLPILSHMLRGIPLLQLPPLEERTKEPVILYEDPWVIAVDKPAGMLSVPGRSDAPSVERWARERWPEITGPVIVHRLDMDTSGILLLAKDKATHQNLQAQFKHRTVQKYYVALLDGVVQEPSGRIELPLRADPHDRPRQRVDRLHGKPAFTEYRVLHLEKEVTRILLHPLTGRTHQLRLHAAHPEGLNAPILGDRLYGHPADRLFLHAERIEFRHPTTGKIIRIESPADF